MICLPSNLFISTTNIKMHITLREIFMDVNITVG